MQSTFLEQDIPSSREKSGCCTEPGTGKEKKNQTCHSPENQEFLRVFPDLCDGHNSLPENLGRERMIDIRKYIEERILGLLDPKSNR